jgi:long-chain acyl-CoA synthetase
LSIPIVNAHTHPLVTGPVFASHALDVQNFPVVSADAEGFSTVAHVGPPGINVEAKLIEVNDEEIESGADPMGDLLVRGPPVGRLIGGDDEMRKLGWVSTGDKARVQTNGSFKVYNL